MSVPSDVPPTEDDALQELLLTVGADYRRQFQSAPRWLVTAPGRVNLIGDHIDYNDGFVLPMAIERYVVMAAGPDEKTGPDGEPWGRFVSSNLQQQFSVSLKPPVDRGPADWSRYLRGVVSGCLERGFSLPSFRAVIRSTVPIGSGLSSSAALEVATATLMEAMAGIELDLETKALLCQQAEHEFAGMPCGIMDQFSSVFGQAGSLMLIDCQSRQVTQIPFQCSDVAILIINSRVHHELTGGEYGERRRQCDEAARLLKIRSWRDISVEEFESRSSALPTVTKARARHVVTETARTRHCAAAIARQDWQAAGELMYASHASLRDDFEVSCRELDLLVDLAHELNLAGGVFGSRMTGGGFGGCTVTLARVDRAETVASRICDEYRRRTGIEADAFVSQPAWGAHGVHVATEDFSRHPGRTGS